MFSIALFCATKFFLIIQLVEKNYFLKKSDFDDEKTFSASFHSQTQTNEGKTTKKALHFSKETKICLIKPQRSPMGF